MKHAAFRILLDAVHSRMVALTESKGEEYKGAEDNQFGNFERTAQDTGLSREQVWLVFFNKHFDALRTYVRDKATGKERQRSESIVGRIDDAILYLILLRGMVGQNEAEILTPEYGEPHLLAVPCKGDEYQGCRGVLTFDLNKDMLSSRKCPICLKWFKLKSVKPTDNGFVTQIERVESLDGR